MEVNEQQYTDVELDRDIFDFLTIVQNDVAEAYTIVDSSGKFYITELGIIKHFIIPRHTIYYTTPSITHILCNTYLLIY